MNLEDIMLNEISQWQDNNYGMISPTGGIKSGQTQRKRVELLVAREPRGGGNELFKGYRVSVLQDEKGQLYNNVNILSTTE